MCIAHFAFVICVCLFISTTTAAVITTPTYTQNAQVPVRNTTTAAAAGGQIPIRILTFNIRYAATERAENEKTWQERKPFVMNTLKYNTRNYNKKETMKTNEYSPAAFICLQEVLHSQLQDVLGGLNDINSTSATKTPKWSYIGIAREDGRQQGEYSPLLYSSDTFNLLYSENTWLSSTPNKPSKPWYAGSVRVLTLGVFEHKMTGERILSANTHLDNSSSKARREGIIRVLERLEQMKSKWSLRNKELPVFLGGDFNSFPTQEAYKEMVKRKAMADVFTLVQPTQRYGDIKTFTAFGPKQDVSEQGRIDFVWLGPFSKVKSADYSIPTTTTTPTPQPLRR